jgi:hypothetical protein
VQVRRDSCPAVAKTMEQAVRLLFQTDNLTRVMKYLIRQWRKILSGRVSIHDFIFCKEVGRTPFTPPSELDVVPPTAFPGEAVLVACRRVGSVTDDRTATQVKLGSYTGPSYPPAAIVALKAMQVDPRSKPQYAERVPYVVVNGQPGAMRLSQLVVSPYALVDDPRLSLNFEYYLKKMVRALHLNRSGRRALSASAGTASLTAHAGWCWCGVWLCTPDQPVAAAGAGTGWRGRGAVVPRHAHAAAARRQARRRRGRLQGGRAADSAAVLPLAGEVLPLPFLRYRRVKIQGRGR